MSVCWWRGGGCLLADTYVGVLVEGSLFTSRHLCLCVGGVGGGLFIVDVCVCVLVRGPCLLVDTYVCVLVEGSLFTSRRLCLCVGGEGALFTSRRLCLCVGEGALFTSRHLCLCVGGEGALFIVDACVCVLVEGVGALFTSRRLGFSQRGAHIAYNMAYETGSTDIGPSERGSPNLSGKIPTIMLRRSNIHCLNRENLCPSTSNSS